ncbi:MAG TPA: aldo/keto reductase [Pirellulales bacterium]|jgi:aryl-alcohol dehydrogenase-like predicted oxidoreductase
MRYNRIGRAGLQVSAVGLGNWNTHGVTLEKAAALEILRAARDAGINFLDTADTYGRGEGETILGEFLAESNRDHFVVATKLFFPMSADPNDRGLSRKHIVCSVERSLRHFRTDYIDLLQCHRFDEQTPIDETVAAMSDLVRQGKILYWGVSRYSDQQVIACHETAARLGGQAPISNQFTYNLLERRVEQNVLPVCHSLGVGVIGYSPLAQGVLTGKYLGGECPAGSRAASALTRKDMWQHQADTEPVVRELRAVALRHDMDLVTLAIAWCLRSPAVCAVLTGASRPAQILHNARAAGVELSAECVAEIEVVFAGNRNETKIVPNLHPALVSQGSSLPCN